MPTLKTAQNLRFKLESGERNIRLSGQRSGELAGKCEFISFKLIHITRHLLSIYQEFGLMVCTQCCFPL